MLRYSHILGSQSWRSTSHLTSAIFFLLHGSLHLVTITLRKLRVFVDPKSWAYCLVYLETCKKPSHSIFSTTFDSKCIITSYELWPNYVPSRLTFSKPIKKLLTEVKTQKKLHIKLKNFFETVSLARNHIQNWWKIVL